MVGSILSMALHRPADVAARYGGEEFMLLLPNTGNEGARQVAERIRSTLQDMALPHATSPVSSVVTISIGIAAMVPERESDVHTLVDLADRALYRSKSHGRNRITAAVNRSQLLDDTAEAEVECAPA
jgi:diguanylate cyclase (GGDEF)-like protein